MAINYFTRVCVSFLPSIFLPGKRVYVSRFPGFADFCEHVSVSFPDVNPVDYLHLYDFKGWYVVDSVINYRNGVTEIGLDIDGDIEYYDLSELTITAVAPGER